jgi:alkanesulfonate monooxygenase SsuD/methylene tetrahydromethanopterin reductase-like flavin-dependent oxidoreductase (luciferase family)
MTAEHHGGLPGYLPNPLQLAGFLLDAMPHGWAAPSPLLLPLRPAALVIEEIAWLAARFPGRVGLGVAAGALELDFEIMDTTMDDLTGRFEAALVIVAAALRGDAPEALRADPAVARCATDPIPLLSAAASITAARRAARVGAGLMFDSLVRPTRVRELVDAYRRDGGEGDCVLVRRAWLGELPRAAFDNQVNVYRGYASTDTPAHWGEDEIALGSHANEVAEQLVESCRVAGATALNLRVQVPGIAPDVAREQIVALGTEVLPLVKRALVAS